MSYARFSEGDVYVFRSNLGIECCMCLLQARGWEEDSTAPLGGWMREVGPHIENVFDTPDGMLAHLQQHIDVGHHVPPRAIDRLREEAA